MRAYVYTCILLELRAQNVPRVINAPCINPNTECPPAEILKYEIINTSTVLSVSARVRETARITQEIAHVTVHDLLHMTSGLQPYGAARPSTHD